MKMTLKQAFEMIDRGETPDQYEKRIKRIRALANERDDLIDCIEVLKDDTDPHYVAKREKKQKRLEKVLKELEELT